MGIFRPESIPEPTDVEILDNSLIDEVLEVDPRQYWGLH